MLHPWPCHSSRTSLVKYPSSAPGLVRLIAAEPLLPAVARVHADLEPAPERERSPETDLVVGYERQPAAYLDLVRAV